MNSQTKFYKNEMTVHSLLYLKTIPVRYKCPQPYVNAHIKTECPHKYINAHKDMEMPTVIPNAL